MEKQGKKVGVNFPKAAAAAECIGWPGSQGRLPSRKVYIYMYIYM
jgi:hypothetical protein